MKGNRLQLLGNGSIALNILSVQLFSIQSVKCIFFRLLGIRDGNEFLKILTAQKKMRLKITSKYHEVRKIGLRMGSVETFNHGFLTQ